MGYFCRAFAVFSFSLVALTQPIIAKKVELKKQKYSNRRLLVRYKKDASEQKIAAARFSAGAYVIKSYKYPENLDLVEIAKGISVDAAQEYFRQNPNVKYVERDVIFHALLEPPPVGAFPRNNNFDTGSENLVDPRLREQWGLNNIGQTGGSSDVDINALEAWERGYVGDDNLVLGIIDTGVNYNHPDLKPNMWVNPLEIPENGIDDDGNGYVDDIHGANIVSNNGDPMDDHGHGSHCAGIIAARGNNNYGGSGVMHNAKIIACKFLSANGSGSASDAIACLNYFRDLKIRAVLPANIFATSNSWGGAESSQALKDAIQEHQDAGILFFAAASNEGQNNDITDMFPANYPLANVVSVAAINHDGAITSFSNYGKRTVHVSAPGEGILSTTLGRDYELMDGTSMAAPFAVGLAGLIKASRPELNFLQVKNLLMAGGIPEDSLQEKTLSGRRIRAWDNNGFGSLSCKNQFVSGRMNPSLDRLVLAVEQPVLLSAININCAEANGEIIVPIVSHQKESLRLQDFGTNKDSAPNDGLYTAEWKSNVAGQFKFLFPQDDLVTINVFDPATMRKYEATEELYNYINITGVSLDASDDWVGSIDLPFDINFADSSISFDRINIDANGVLSLTDMKAIGFNNQEFPVPNLVSLIAPFWDDLKPDPFGGNIYYEKIGSAPNRKFVIEWRDVKHFAAPDSVTFQVVFFENSSDIIFSYKDLDCGNPAYSFGAHATIGIQATPELNSLIAFDMPQVQSRTTIRFSANFHKN